MKRRCFSRGFRNQPESTFLCQTGTSSENTSSPNVAFASDGLGWGDFGYLGRSGTPALIAWALAGPSTVSNTGISGYRGVVTLEEKSTLGDNSTVSYRCTTDPPKPTSGHNYSTGAPTFAPDATFTVKLLAQ